MVKIIQQHRKTISLSVDDQLQVILKVPYGLPKSEIEKILREKDEWIVTRQSMVKEKLKARDWFYNKKLLYLGADRPLKVVRCKNEIYRIHYKENAFELEVPEEASDEAIHKFVRAHLKQEVLQYFTIFTEDYCKRLGLSYNKITIRQQKTRWGSCSRQGNLSYNIKLIGAPKEVMAYVALHEVMHLKYFNHSADFWNAIETIMPEYKKYETYLKANGRRLEI